MSISKSANLLDYQLQETSIIFFINILSEHSGWHLLQDTSLMKLCSTMTWFLSTFLFRLLWLSYPLPFFHLCASLSVYRLRVPMVPSVVPPSVCLVVRLLLRQPLWYSRMSLPLFCLSSCHLKRSPSVGPASKGRRVSTITALCELCALLSRFVFVCACAVAVRWHDVKYSSLLFLVVAVYIWTTAGSSVSVRFVFWGRALGLVVHGCLWGLDKQVCSGLSCVPLWCTVRLWSVFVSHAYTDHNVWFKHVSFLLPLLLWPSLCVCLCRVDSSLCPLLLRWIPWITSPPPTLHPEKTTPRRSSNPGPVLPQWPVIWSP